MSTVEGSVGSRATRRAFRRSQVQHLITADERSLAELELLLTTLPLCAVGRVFIEVPELGDISVVTAPPRMTVTWLPRSRRGRDRCAIGGTLTRAATAWADEMLCGQSEAELLPEVTLLGDYLSTVDIFEHLTERCDVSPTAIHAPARYGLPVR